MEMVYSMIGMKRGAAMSTTVEIPQTSQIPQTPKIPQTPQPRQILHEADDIDARLGMRLFLITEILLLGGLFLLYTVYHSRFSEDFYFCAGTLDIAAATIGEIILIFGSLAMSLAVSCLKNKKRRRASIFFSAVLFSGAVFLITRFVEWSSLLKRDLFPNSKIILQHTQGENMFYSLYYLATGLHGICSAFAMVMLSFILFKVSRKTTEILSETETDRLALRAENAAAFWYLLSGIWFFLLPIFYFADIPAKYLPILPYVVFLLLLQHLPYLGMLLGLAALSTIYRHWKPELSRDFINLAPVKLPSWFAFGFFPPWPWLFYTNCCWPIPPSPSIFFYCAS